MPNYRHTWSLVHLSTISLAADVAPMQRPDGWPATRFSDSAPIFFVVVETWKPDCSSKAPRGHLIALWGGNIGSTIEVLFASFSPPPLIFTHVLSSIRSCGGLKKNMAGAASGYTDEKRVPRYSVIDGAGKATTELQKIAGGQLPLELLKHLQDVQLTTATDGTQIYFPCPFKETEATVALKSIEASAVAAIADIRYGEERRKIEINLERTATFLFSTYIATIAGMGKQDPKTKSRLKSKCT